MSNIQKEMFVGFRKFLSVFMILTIWVTLSAAEKKEEKDKKEKEPSVCEFKHFKKDKEKYFYGEKKEKIKKDIEEIREGVKESAIDKVLDQANELLKLQLLKILCGEKCSEVESSEPFKRRLENFIREIRLEIKVECGEDENNKYSCCHAELEKEKVTELINRNVEEKKRRIENEYRAFVDELDRMLMGNAIQRLFRMADYLEENFGDLLLFSDFLGEEMDLRTVIEHEVAKITKDTILSAEQGRTLFGGDGIVDTMPKVSVYYEDNERRYPVAKLPLRVSFVEGEGNAEERIQTSKTGTAEIKIYRVEPRYRKAVIRAEVDLSNFKSASRVSFNYVDIELVKRPTAGYNLKFIINNKAVRLPAFEKKIIEVFRSKKFDVQEKNNFAVSPENLLFLHDEGIEYFVSVELKSSGGRVEGHNLYYAYASGEYAIYDTRTRQMIYSGSFSQSRGFGLSEREAGINAINQLSSSVINELKGGMPSANEIE